MTRLFVFFSILILSLAASADPVNGVIVRTIFQTQIQTDDGATYKLISRSSDVQRTLRRLEDGDSIVSNGRLDKINKVAEIDTIDFVGLSKIIGLWTAISSKSMMQFKSFSDVNIYTFMLQSNGSSVVRNRKNFKYTLSPTNNGEWVMFLSDDTATQMGFLKLSESDATISLLNSQTGDIQNVLQLKKIGH